MKEIFQQPFIEVIYFEAEDIVTSSLTCSDPNETIEIDA